MIFTRDDKNLCVDLYLSIQWDFQGDQYLYMGPSFALIRISFEVIKGELKK